MKCAWQAYLNLLPIWMRSEVDKHGRENLQELRLRIDRVPELIMANGSKQLQRNITAEDLAYCVNAASRYSPWASESIKYGYITAPGGHRLGICGNTAIVNGQISTITNVTSICIRVARDFPGVGMNLTKLKESTLIIGPPGSGKSTLLRDFVRQKSNSGYGPIAIVDERYELFPLVDGSFCFSPGQSTDVLSGCRKADGLPMLIRTMSPRWIAVDEITAEQDANALIQAAWCGINLIATAHASSIRELHSRMVYRPIIESGLFENLVIMGFDKSWIVERIHT